MKTLFIGRTRELSELSRLYQVTKLSFSFCMAEDGLEKPA